MSNKENNQSGDLFNHHEMMQRIGRVEVAMNELKARVQRMQTQIDLKQKELYSPAPSDLFVHRLAHLENFLLTKFPQLAKEMEEFTAQAEPGLTGFGEIGPGGAKFPETCDTELEIDFYKRQILPN